MLVFPVSSAVCERGFSSQKIIKFDTWASLDTDTGEDLIRISVEGLVWGTLMQESAAGKGQDDHTTGAGHLRGLGQHRRIFCEEPFEFVKHFKPQHYLHYIFICEENIKN